MITVQSLSRGAAFDKLGLMSTAGEEEAISVCLTTCAAPYLAVRTVHTFVCVQG